MGCGKVAGMSKASLLRGMLRSSELEFLMEAHDGLSAKIAEVDGSGMAEAV